MATVNTIQRLWEGLPEAEVTQQRAALNYIVELATRTNQSLARVDLIRTFGDPNTQRLTIDRRQINRRFYDRFGSAGVVTEPAVTAPAPTDLAQIVASPAPAPTPVEVVSPATPESRTLPAAMRATLAQRMARRTTTELERLRAEQERHIASANATYSRYMEFLTLAARSGNQVRDLMRTPPEAPTTNPSIESIAPIMARGFFTEPMLGDDELAAQLWLKTGAIVLSNRRPSANLDTCVQLGRFAVAIDMGERPAIRVLPLQGNKSTTRNGPAAGGSPAFYHPHIDAGGTICWGDSHTQANRLIVEQKWGEVLTLLESVLMTYNDNNPYVQLEHFVDAPTYPYRSAPSRIPYER